MNHKPTIIISGGGTGGHIFPAIAIADALKDLHGDSLYIHFVGANGRMEMEKVPQSGYEITGLDIAGIQRGLTWESFKRNLLFPFKLIHSIIQAYRLIKKTKPTCVIGVGGYASGPTLFVAQLLGIKTFIQEQNSYAGITNKLLANKAILIFTAYENMESFFPKQKIKQTGNPVRKDILHVGLLKFPGLTFFKLDPNKKTILVIGGSLGAGSINKALLKDWFKIKQAGHQLIWQTGKNFKADESLLAEKGWIICTPFIKEMQWAYGCADIIISRAGALSISELCIVGKPTILVPSPNVAEDHQTKNAMHLVSKEAALLVKDADTTVMLINTCLDVLKNAELCHKLSTNIAKMASYDSAESIAKHITAQL